MNPLDDVKAEVARMRSVADEALTEDWNTPSGRAYIQGQRDAAIKVLLIIDRARVRYMSRAMEHGLHR